MSRIVRLRDHSGSKEITIPKSWCEDWDWKRGDTLCLVKRDNKVIIMKIDIDQIIAGEEFPV